MQSYIQIFCLSVILCMSSSESARILFLAPIGSKSHKNAFMPVIKELGKRGHEVTHVTHTKSSKQYPGVTEVEIEGAAEFLKSVIGDKPLIGEQTMGLSGMMYILPQFKRAFVEGCEIILKNPYTKDLVSGKVAKPDLVIASMFFNECNMGVIHMLDVPFIYFSPAMVMPWLLSSLRSPEEPTYCPMVGGESDNRMSFMERVKGTAMFWAYTAIRDLYVGPSIQEIARSHLGNDIPRFQDLEKNVSLILLNNHFSMDFPRPLTPNIIEAGGMHINEAKPLPKDLEEWFQSSGDEGIIYFSLGTAFPGSSMPEKFRLIFIEAFSKLPQKVIWKWEKDEMSDLPPNVRISKWLPQQNILAHPKLKVFITHGGLLSTMETTYFGVPVIGIPIAADQQMNMRNTEMSGAGVMITWKELSTEKLLATINELITNPKYQQNVAYRSAVAKDRDMHPLDKAIYWIEYVIRHKGAHHLKPGSMYLSDLAYYKLDIYLFFHSIVAIWLIVTVLSCWFICRKICKTKVKKD